MYRASVIIPTHQRAASLPRTLNSLAKQDLPCQLFEVVVAADSCSDGTEQVVHKFAEQAPYRLRVVTHNRNSAGATRNLGASQAEGATLIFVDDDIEAAPSLVRAHLLAQEQGNEVVSLGYLKPALPARPSQWHLEARLWWEDRYRDMRETGHRFGYRDFFSGNCSMPASLFQRVGGFAEEFSRLEDYEFGFRLLQSGAHLVFVPEAKCLHHDSTDLFKWMRRIRDEGSSDIQLGSRHPILRRKLFDSRPLSGVPGLIQRLAFSINRGADALVNAGLRLALVFEAVRLRRRRNAIVHALRLFNYWRGVAAEVKSLPALTEWTEEGTYGGVIQADAPSLEWTRVQVPVELKDVLAEGSLKGLRVLVDGIELLRIAPEPWCEPLTIGHIELAIRRRCDEEVAPAIVPMSVRAVLEGHRNTVGHGGARC